MKNLKIRTKNLYFAALYYCDGYSLKRVGCIPVKRSRWGSFVNGVESYKNVVTKEIYPDAFKVFESVIYNTGEEFNYEIVQQVGTPEVNYSIFKIEDELHPSLLLDKNKVIVIGNEANGVSEKVLEVANKKVKIPMLGKTESLNAAVATGIVLYEYVRRKI